MVSRMIRRKNVTGCSSLNILVRIPLKTLDLKDLGQGLVKIQTLKTASAASAKTEKRPQEEKLSPSLVPRNQTISPRRLAPPAKQTGRLRARQRLYIRSLKARKSLPR